MITNEELRNAHNFVIELEDDQDHEPDIALVDSARSLVGYFNMILGFRLLYSSEHRQYQDIVQKTAMSVPFEEIENFEFRASEHYGIVHFVRFISMLPKLLAEGGGSRALVTHVQIGITPLVEFLTNNLTTFFREEAHFCSQNEEDEENKTPEIPV